MDSNETLVVTAFHWVFWQHKALKPAQVPGLKDLMLLSLAPFRLLPTNLIIAYAVLHLVGDSTENEMCLKFQGFVFPKNLAMHCYLKDCDFF